MPISFVFGVNETVFARLREENAKQLCGGEMCAPRLISYCLVLLERRAVRGGNRGLSADQTSSRAARHTPVTDKRCHRGLVFAG